MSMEHNKIHCSKEKMRLMIPKLPELKSRCIYENGMEELECELCGDTFY